MKPIIALFLLLSSSSPTEREFPATVVDVHDGDTITVDIDLGLDVILRAQKIRLRGIDAPELSTPDGKRVAGVLRAFVDEHRADAVSVVIGGREKYGRWLATLRIAGVDVNAWLVATSNARSYDGGRR